ncbi:hypothetical protein [Streptomyces sp. NPDC086023]|uniref:hypothetical protein n=1 Tax=Streptomyces sp. NPDC086023 TaxID=3365746 RepID=UPI0037D2BECB
MSSYRGPAILITVDGREYEVTAHLRKAPNGLRTSWGGTLSVPISQRPAELSTLTVGRVRLGTNEGAFVRPDISDWLGSPPNVFQITIEGNGDEPF